MSNPADFIASIPDSPRGILHFVSGLLLAHGYAVIFIGAALDNFGLPASGDVVLFAGGWFANLGRVALPLVMLSGFAGALVSDNAVYWIGGAAVSVFLIVAAARAHLTLATDVANRGRLANG